MFEKLFRRIRQEQKSTEDQKAVREKLRKENITHGFPNLGTGVAHRKHETQPNRPKTVIHGKVVYRDRGDGEYESDNGSILPYAVLAAALLTDHSEANVHGQNFSSIQGGDGESGGAGASGGWDSTLESSQSDSSSDSSSSGSNDSGSSSSE